MNNHDNYSKCHMHVTAIVRQYILDFQLMRIGPVAASFMVVHDQECIGLCRISHARNV